MAVTGARDIQRRLHAVREAIAAAARRSGRDPDDVILIGATKGVAAEAIREAIAAGLGHLGENRAQELARKHRELGDVVTWHFIGHLQRNKVKSVVDFVAVVHSLDRWALALELDRRGRLRGRPVEALVQVNVAGEATKHGLAPEEVPPFLDRLASLDGVRVTGLMTIAPPVREPEEVRPVFRRLRRLREELSGGRPGLDLKHLSMGMSGDFQVAVEEGATMVRVGTAIFGDRPAT